MSYIIVLHTIYHVSRISGMCFFYFRTDLQTTSLTGVVYVCFDRRTLALNCDSWCRVATATFHRLFSPITIFNSYIEDGNIFLLQMNWINFLRVYIVPLRLVKYLILSTLFRCVECSACFRICHCYSWGGLFDFTFLLFSFLCIGPWWNRFISYTQGSSKTGFFYAALFNHSLRLGDFSTSLKRVFMQPLLKVSPPCLPPDTRPIANLCEMLKILKRILPRQITSFIAANNTIDSRQSGFRGGGG